MEQVIHRTYGTLSRRSDDGLYKRGTSYNEKAETYVFLSCRAVGTIGHNRCAPHDAVNFSFVFGGNLIGLVCSPVSTTVISSTRSFIDMIYTRAQWCLKFEFIVEICYLLDNNPSTCIALDCIDQNIPFRRS